MKKINLFKIFIPIDNAQQVTELESFSVTWYVKQGWADTTIRHAKIFVYKDDAKEFQKQLIESAKLIGCWIKTELDKN